MLGALILAAVALHEDAMTECPGCGPKAEETVDFSVRAVTGAVGTGNLYRLGARGGLEANYWYSPHFAVGGVAGVASQFELFSASSTLSFVGPLFSYRGHSRGSWWMLGVSTGYAHRHDHYHPFCIYGT